jgi:3-oxoacyl-[acyl-carrier-protein] synthase II
MKRRVVITGLGVITSIGTGINQFWGNMKEGKCGISLLEAFDTSDFKVKLAAEVKDFDPTLYMDKKEAKRQDRFTQFALAASELAVQDSALDVEKVDKEKFGVIIGSAVGGIKTIEAECEKLFNKGPSKVSTFFVPMMLSNIAAGNVAIKYGANGINYNIVTACASGANAIGEGFKSIQNGTSDVIIAGGAEASISASAVAGFQALTALSTATDPNRASIPFDKERDGFVMSEGAAIMILEDYDHAIARGAKIYAEVAGYGFTCDAYHVTSPDPKAEQTSRAILNAIKDAGITPDEIGYINAHGTSTGYNDQFETAAIKKVFGENAINVPVSSTKSMTGHMLGAAGAIEAVVIAKAVEDSFVPATINYKVEDPNCDLDYVPNVGRQKEIEYALSNSFGFGGHNTTLVIKKYSGK